MLQRSLYNAAGPTTGPHTGMQRGYWRTVSRGGRCGVGRGFIECWEAAVKRDWKGPQLR